MDIILIYFAIKYKGDWNKIYEALDKKERPELKDLRELENEIAKSKTKVLTIIDKNYPLELKKAYKPPFVLWYQGDLKRLTKQTICVTGNKVDPTTNKRITENINKLNEQYELIIPSFNGVDKVIEEVFTRSLIKVLPHGIDFSKSSDDLLISEFPPAIQNPEREFFRQRNRIIAALSGQLVLFSSNPKGAINHLVSAFLNLGKEVSCFPGDGTEKDGNSELIKQGANLITNISEVC